MYMDNILPLLYTMAIHKVEITYCIMHHELKNAVLNFNLTLSPQYAVADFESANINALKIALNKTEVTGCLFHFGQSLW